MSLTTVSTLLLILSLTTNTFAFTTYPQKALIPITKSFFPKQEIQNVYAHKAKSDDDDETSAVTTTSPKKMETGMRQKLVSESVAPWRGLRLFLYAGLGSGAVVGGLITLSGVAAAMSGARSDVDLNTEYLNLGIDFGAAALFALLAKFDLDKGKELEGKVEEKLERKKEQSKITRSMRKREKQELLNLSLTIQISADGETTDARISAIQEGAKQHVIIVAGPRKATKDALVGANLLKLDFAMSNILVVPYEIGDKDKDIRPAGGFGDRPIWETQPYVAMPTGEGWESYIEAEMNDAIQQSGPAVKEEGIVIVLANNGEVIRRGVGKVPWRQMVEELNESVAPKEKDDY